MAKKPAADDAATATGSKKKLYLGLAAVAALGGAYKFVLAPQPAAEAGTDAAAAADVAPPDEGEIFELPEVVINLADADTRYARVGLALVLEQGVVAKEFEAESAIAKDVALNYLSKLTYAQLRDPAVKEQAKADLSRDIRAAYRDDKVVRVLWTVLVMQ